MAFQFWDPAGDEPVYASRLNQGALWHADDLTDLEDTDTTDLPNNAKVIVENDGLSPVASIYLFDKVATDTADGVYIVEPDTGGGRFFRQVANQSAKNVTQTSHGFTAPSLVYYNPGYIQRTAYDNVPDDVSAQTTNPVCVEFSGDGTKMFVLGSNGTLYQYSTVVNYRPQGATYDSVSHAFGANFQRFCFNSDGTKIYLTFDNGATEYVQAFPLSSAYNAATVGASLGTFDPGGGNPRGLCMNAAETRIYVVNNNTLDIREITLATPDDITTASSTGTHTLSPEFSAAMDIALESDGLTAYLLDTNIVYKCTFGTAGDIDTFGTSNETFDLSNGSTYTANSLKLSRDANQTYFYVADDNGNNIDRFTRDLGGEWDLVDASDPFTCTDVYFLSEVIDSNNFIAVKNGTVIVTDHGLAGASNMIFSTRDVDDTDYQAGSGDTRHTWGSAQTIQGVTTDHWIELKLFPGTTFESAHSGVFPITAVDASGLYLQYKNRGITSASYDLTGLGDTTHRISVYGAGRAGDVLYASEVAGRLSPFPANGGHVELPVATIVDANTLMVNCPVGIPPASRNKIIAAFVGRSVSAITDLLGHQRASMRNPQNWKLKVTYNTDDEAIQMRIRLAKASHRGGERREWVSSTPAIDNSTSASTVSESAISRSDLDLLMEAISGADRKSGWGMLVYDGELLHWESQAFSDDGSFAHMAQYYNCNLSEAVLSAVGVGATANVFDITVQRMT